MKLFKIFLINIILNLILSDLKEVFYQKANDYYRIDIKNIKRKLPTKYIISSELAYTNKYLFFKNNKGVYYQDITKKDSKPQFLKEIDSITKGKKFVYLSNSTGMYIYDNSNIKDLDLNELPKINKEYLKYSIKEINKNLILGDQYIFNLKLNKINKYDKVIISLDKFQILFKLKNEYKILNSDLLVIKKFTKDDLKFHELVGFYLNFFIEKEILGFKKIQYNLFKIENKIDGNGYERREINPNSKIKNDLEKNYILELVDNFLIMGTYYYNILQFNPNKKQSYQYIKLEKNYEINKFSFYNSNILEIIMTKKSELNEKKIVFKFSRMKPLNIISDQKYLKFNYTKYINNESININYNLLVTLRNNSNNSKEVFYYNENSNLEVLYTIKNNEKLLKIDSDSNYLSLLIENKKLNEEFLILYKWTDKFNMEFKKLYLTKDENKLKVYQNTIIYEKNDIKINKKLKKENKILKKENKKLINKIKKIQKIINNNSKIKNYEIENNSKNNLFKIIISSLLIVFFILFFIIFFYLKNKKNKKSKKLISNLIKLYN